MPNRPHAVVVRLREVPVAREHLQRPEPQEEEREHPEGEEREDRDAQRELRRQPVGLRDARVAGQEPAAAFGLAKEPHLANAVAELERREEPAHERVDRQRQQQVEQQAERQPVRDEARRRRLAEQELQRRAGRSA